MVFLFEYKKEEASEFLPRLLILNNSLTLKTLNQICLRILLASLFKAENIATLRIASSVKIPTK